MAQNIVAAAVGAILGAIALYFITGIPGEVDDLDRRVARIEGKLDMFVALKDEVNVLQERVQYVEKEIKEKFSPKSLSVDFTPSGWMGDGGKGGEFLKTDPTSADVEGTTRAATCFSYTRGNVGWAGVYWQHPENNWGDSPGVDLTGAEEITFYARGANGGEIVEFLSGGIRGKKHEDSYRASTGKVALGKQWSKYSIKLAGYDLSSVIGAFAWSAPGNRNAPLDFCIADITVR